MNNLTKNLLSWLVVVLASVLIVFFWASTKQKLETAATANTVSFSGEGKVVAKPDVAVVSFSIVTEGAVSKDAQDKNSTKSKEVTDFLKKQRIDEKDIKTTGYNIYPQYVYSQYDKPQIRGYQVNQTLEIKVRDLDNVSKILDGIVTAGVNQINNLSFQIDEPEKLKAQARETAINDAKKKASELKNQLGISLGKIVNFSEGFSGIPGPIFYGAETISKEGYGGGPSVPSGENEITVNITITYQIR